MRKCYFVWFFFLIFIHFVYETASLSSINISFSVIIIYNHFIIQSFYHFIIQSFYHFIIQSFYHSIILSFYHFIILSFYHSIILSLPIKFVIVPKIQTNIWQLMAFFCQRQMLLMIFLI